MSDAAEAGHGAAVTTSLAAAGATVIAGRPSHAMGIRQARLEGPAGLQLTLFTGKADPGTSE